MEPLRPLVLVDVDGVLNPSRSQAPGYRRQWVFPGGLPRRLLLNASHGTMLTELAAATGTELVWATYWRNQANRWVAPRLGLPPLRFVPIERPFWPPAASSLGTWKARHVAAWVGLTPFVWFEDDASAVRHAARQLDTGRHLVVKVDPLIGLTSAHVERARSWLDSVPR